MISAMLYSFTKYPATFVEVCGTFLHCLYKTYDIVTVNGLGRHLVILRVLPGRSSSASCLSVAFGLHTHEKNSTCSGGSETRGEEGSRVGPPPWTPPACRSPLCEHAARGGGDGNSTAEELEPSRSSRLARARYFWRARGTRQRRRRTRRTLGAPTYQPLGACTRRSLGAPTRGTSTTTVPGARAAVKRAQKGRQ